MVAPDYVVVTKSDDVDWGTLKSDVLIAVMDHVASSAVAVYVLRPTRANENTSADPFAALNKFLTPASSWRNIKFSLSFFDPNSAPNYKPSDNSNDSTSNYSLNCANKISTLQINT